MFWCNCAALYFFFFFFTDTATTEIYTLSLHDALPIWPSVNAGIVIAEAPARWLRKWRRDMPEGVWRSEEHTSELQSRFDLVCRLLLEKKKKIKKKTKDSDKKKETRRHEDLYIIVDSGS